MELVVKYFEELSARELYEILRLRESIFIVEQGCPYQDADGKDLLACHLYLRDADGIQAYLRIMPPSDSRPTVSIGRVLTAKRGHGFGKTIMLEGIRAARERMLADSIYIEAQSYAKGFYEPLGFRQISDEFLEDGIPHIKMLLACLDYTKPQ